ncbi:MAG: hypothetical protein Ct9H300mP28_08330 [Pseudomonadota bacterium]|nr:MAG: hypothetical protein Ct9H300mP28_08330 [Pseudomonadota bacterium]
MNHAVSPRALETISKTSPESLGVLTMRLVDFHFCLIIFFKFFPVIENTHKSRWFGGFRGSSLSPCPARNSYPEP